MKQLSACALAITLVTLTGCMTAPPRDQNNLCNIYRQYPAWYKDSVAMQTQWGTPPNVAMAIMKQESSFVADALPPRAYLLWVIPWGRVSPSYGYAQAQPPAWKDFERAMGRSGSRDNYADAIMFIGWYTAGTQRQLGISKWDAYNQYLAYHEGRGGFTRNTYRGKPWLMQVARKVQQQSQTYGAQLAQWRDELEKEGRSFWFF